MNLREEAKALGISFNSRTSDETLMDKIATAKLEQADPSRMVEVKVLVANLWTTRGKFYLRDSATIPAAEAEALEAADKVVIK